MTTPEPSPPPRRGVWSGAKRGPKNSRNGSGMLVVSALTRVSTRIVATAGATFSTIGLYDRAAGPGEAGALVAAGAAGGAGSLVVARTVARPPATPTPSASATSAATAARGRRG